MKHDGGTHPADERGVLHDPLFSRKYVPELDGLRAIAILIVITVHLKDQVWRWLAGELGVTIFFVLSGYLITTLALREERSHGSVNLRAFYLRRIFRIFPLYYIVLALYCLLIFGLRWWPDKHVSLAHALPYYVGFFQEYPLAINGSRFANIPFYQSWSLGIEEKFYLLWPLLCFVIWRGSKLLRIAGAAVLWLITTIYKPHGLEIIYPYSHVLCGCLLALLLDEPAVLNRLLWLGRTGWTWTAAATLLTLHFAFPWISPKWQLVEESFYGLAVAVFLVSVLLGNGLIQRVLRCRPLIFVGRISYGMYLIHLLALNVAEKLLSHGHAFWHPVAAFVLTCALTIAGAYFLGVTIERPFIAAGKKLSFALQLRKNSPVLQTASAAV